MQNKLRNEKNKKVRKISNYTELLFILASAFSGYVLICSLVFLVGISVGNAGFAITIKFL